jgi:hypothetical protein
VDVGGGIGSTTMVLANAFSRGGSTSARRQKEGILNTNSSQPTSHWIDSDININNLLCLAMRTS